MRTLDDIGGEPANFSIDAAGGKHCHADACIIEIEEGAGLAIADKRAVVEIGAAAPQYQGRLQFPSAVGYHAFINFVEYGFQIFQMTWVRVVEEIGVRGEIEKCIPGFVQILGM